MRWEASGTWADEKHRQGKRKAASSFTRAEEGPREVQGPSSKPRCLRFLLEGCGKFPEARTWLRWCLPPQGTGSCLWGC